MNKRGLLKIVNVLLAILILNQATTGLLSGILPHSLFEFLHEGGGVTIFIVVLVHVYLNWAWVKANLLRGSNKTEK